jgi:hypothetical protein
VRATAPGTQTRVIGLYTWPAGHAPHIAADVPAPVHTGAAPVQSAPEPEPALPRHDGVVHAPLLVLQTCPAPHWLSMVHCTTSVPLLVTPSLVAVTMFEPSERSLGGTQVQVPSAATMTVHVGLPLTDTVTVWPGTPVPARVGRCVVVVPMPPAGGEVSATAGALHACAAVSNTWPLAQVPHDAEAVPGLLHTGVLAGQSALEPEPALPAHDGVVHAPPAVLQTWPTLHCVLDVHSTTSVAELVAPALVAVIVSEPTGRSDDGPHVQVPSAATTVLHTALPLAVTETVLPGTPVPAMGSRTSGLLVVPPAGGDVSATAGATHRNVVVS